MSLLADRFHQFLPLFLSFATPASTCVYTNVLEVNDARHSYMRRIHEDKKEEVENPWEKGAETTRFHTHAEKYVENRDSPCFNR